MCENTGFVTSLTNVKAVVATCVVVFKRICIIFFPLDGSQKDCQHDASHVTLTIIHVCTVRSLGCS